MEHKVKLAIEKFHFFFLREKNDKRVVGGSSLNLEIESQ